VSGAAIKAAIIDPIVVKVVWRSIARPGGSNAPVRMFYKRVVSVYIYGDVFTNTHEHNTPRNAPCIRPHRY
jgi:hypothetical protein